MPYTVKTYTGSASFADVVDPDGRDVGLYLVRDVAQDMARALNAARGQRLHDSIHAADAPIVDLYPGVHEMPPGEKQ
jgi:hypothetical protein